MSRELLRRILREKFPKADLCKSTACLRKRQEVLGIMEGFELVINRSQPAWKRHAHKYLHQIEEIFGACDRKFHLNEINEGIHGEPPHTHFPKGYHCNGNCPVDIIITPYAATKPALAKWQIAHECVHLLDPVIGGYSNFLEEGLATWFQDCLDFHDDEVQEWLKYEPPVHSQGYRQAKDWVLKCQPELLDVVRQLRSSGKKISQISPAHLRLSLIDKVPEEIVRNLCQKFHIDGI